MATKISVELTDSLYQRMQDFARLHQQPVEEAVTALLEQALMADDAESETLDWSEPDPAVDREMEAYIALHPSLKERYFGKYVAIYHGELIDYDDDPALLGARIDKTHPDEFVWMTEVGTEPIQTFAMRSTRLIRE